MTTKPTELPDWATGAATITAPDTAKKLIGWEGGEKPDNGIKNWFWNLVYLWIEHVAGSSSTYTSPEAAIAAMADGDMAYVFEDDSASGPGAELLKVASQGNAAQVATAGDTVITGDGDNDPVGVLRSTLAGADGGGGEDVSYVRTQTAGITGNVIALATDGTIVVAIYGDTLVSTELTYIEAWDIDGTQLWEVAWGEDSCLDVAIEPDGVYVCGQLTDGNGDLAASFHLVKLNRATGATTWGYRHDAGIFNNPNRVATNGLQVFIAGNQAAGEASNASLRAIRASDGFDAAGEGLLGTDASGLSWDTDTGQEVDALSIGHGYVYIGLDNLDSNQVESYGQGDGVIVASYAHPNGAFDVMDLTADQDYLIVAYADIASSPDEGQIEAYDPHDLSLKWVFTDTADDPTPARRAVQRVDSDGFAIFATSKETATLWKIARGNVPVHVRKTAFGELSHSHPWVLIPTQRRI